MSSFKLVHYVRTVPDLYNTCQVCIFLSDHMLHCEQGPPLRICLRRLSICVSSSEVLTPDNGDVWQILRGTIFRFCIFSISGNTADAVIGCSFAHNAKISLYCELMTTHPKKYVVLAQEIEFCENNLQYLWMGVMLPNPSPLSNGKCAIIPSKK